MKLRHFYQVLILTLVFTACQKNDFRSNWFEYHDMNWVGSDFWANRLQDWQVKDGRLECVEGNANKPMRTVHLLSGRLNGENATLNMEVQTGLVNEERDIDSTAASGFLINAGPEMDYRSAAIIHHSPGRGGGWFAGLNKGGALFFMDFLDTTKRIYKIQKIKENTENVILKFEVNPSSNKESMISFSAIDAFSGEDLGSIGMDEISPDRLKGNVALVSHPGNGNETGKYWFKNWKIQGSKFNFYEDRKLGPVVSAQYTLSDQVLKLTAQFMPVCKQDSSKTYLEINREGHWEKIQSANISFPGYTASFKIDDWNYEDDQEFRITYQQISYMEPEYYYGKIKHNPVKKEEITLAGISCNHNNGFANPMEWGAVEKAPYNWQELIWFPHQDLVQNVIKHNPDILFFAGDQVYEGSSPTGRDTEHIYKDYLYKWYLWCWAYRDLTKNTPAIIIPDDHDVYQGNLWGEGGEKAKDIRDGGYIHPPEFVNMVQETQTSHLPDPYDPTLVKQDIGVYYTDLTYGGISFAIIEDRKFKSGPNEVLPAAGIDLQNRNKLKENPELADVSGAKLLGDRQLDFLEQWVTDWQNASMKAVLSQTVFANVSTHTGPHMHKINLDFDSNGWPQSGRNRALEVIRKGFAFMIGGDQHLASVVHHGIKNFNDAGWSFCVPATANFYPRAWKPDKPGKQLDIPDYTGEFYDNFDNKITVFAVANPPKDFDIEPSALYDRVPGYGIVKFNKSLNTITMECWPRHVDPSDPSSGSQYEGWPITIKVKDNYGRKADFWLPELNLSGMVNPVIKIFKDDQLIYALRIQDNNYRPKVFEKGDYTIIVEDPEEDKKKMFENISTVSKSNQDTLSVHL